MTPVAALALAFASGFVALSYEIVWYRVYAVAMGSRAQVFGVLLGGYLLGLAAGAFVGRVACRASASKAQARVVLGAGLFSSSVLGFLFVPAFAWLITQPHGWMASSVLLSLTAAGLGIIFPMIAHNSVAPGSDVGVGVSYIYLFNILGSASGSLLTGLVLTDYCTLPTLTLLMGLTALLCSAGLLLSAGRGRLASIGTALGILCVAGAMIGTTPTLFTNVYAKLIFKSRYSSVDAPLAYVVENRAGVIAVTADGTVFGAGLYDGVYNTDLHQDDRNLIHRAYAIGALHASPKSVLMIGLSSGSWAAVVANHPNVERVTVVEINPGYRELLPHYPVVSSLTSDRKVRMETDDGRRWLVRHPEERFDVIIANTTYAWRSNATSLLSVEFLQVIRQHLKSGGVYYFNTTGEPRVQRTGAVTFPYAWLERNMLAVSDSPFTPDADRFARQLASYRLYGAPVLDLGQTDDRALLERIVGDVKGSLEDRDDLLRRTAGAELITDDNMGTEWTLPSRFWLR